MQDKEINIDDSGEIEYIIPDMNPSGLASDTLLSLSVNLNNQCFKPLMTGLS